MLLLGKKPENIVICTNKISIQNDTFAIVLHSKESCNK